MTAFYKILFFISDLILLNLSVLAAFYFHDQSFLSTSKAEFVYLFLYSNLTWMFLILVSTPYNVRKTWTLSKTLKNQVAFILIHLLVVGSLIVFFDRQYSIYQVLIIYLIFAPLFFISRLVIYYLRRIFVGELPYKNFIIIGKNDMAEEVRRFYLVNPELTYKFRGSIDLNSPNFSISAVNQLCTENEIHEIFCCAPAVSKEQLNQLVNFGLDSFIKVRLILDSASPDKLALQLEKYDSLPALDIAVIRLDDPLNQLAKRMFDIAFTVTVLMLILSWLVPLLAILIKLDSNGPVFFLQLRSGKDNKPFWFIKFRTMVVNSDSDVKQATVNDPRVTRLGRFLRKSSLDELPQFINVLSGTMSIVGPRPHMLKHTDEYSKLIEKFLGRHYVKPGITGLAQCLGYRGETRDLVDMENRVRLDRYYIENWTFWLDIKVIFLTVVSLIRGSEKAF